MAINEINTLRIAFLLLFDPRAPFACSHIVLTHEYLNVIAFDLWAYFFFGKQISHLSVEAPLAKRGFEKTIKQF